MKRLLTCLTLSLGVALAAAPSLPAAPGGDSSSFFLRDGKPDLALSICDALNTPQVIVVGQPDQAGRSEVAVYDKDGSGRYSYQAYAVGRADPGAGQVYYALTARDGQGKTQGYIHAVNPGMLDTPSLVLTPPIAQVNLGTGAVASCRWTPGIRVLGFTSRRSFTVTQDASGNLTYRSFNFGASPLRLTAPGGMSQTSAASATVTGGRESRAASGSSFIFSKADYTYTVRVNDSGVGSLSVSRSGKTLQTERLNGYTLAVPK